MNIFQKVLVKNNKFIALTIILIMIRIASNIKLN